MVPYFVYYAIMDGLAFKNVIGESLSVKDKNHLRNSFLLTFIVTACINYNSYKVNLFFFLPSYMLVYYFSMQSIRNEQNKIRDALMSEELKALVPKIPVLT